MAVTSKANAQWTGSSLGDGSGQAKLASGSEFAMSWKARAEEGRAVTPEELIAGAHASCYSMALTHTLDEAGFSSEKVATAAEVDFVAGEGITEIRLSVEATIPGIDDAKFRELAEAAKDGCPVSQALAGTTIKLASASLSS